MYNQTLLCRTFVEIVKDFVKDYPNYFVDTCFLANHNIFVSAKTDIESFIARINVAPNNPIQLLIRPAPFDEIHTAYSDFNANVVSDILSKIQAVMV